MKNIGYAVSLACCLLMTEAYAQELQPNEVLSLTVSNKGITRLSIEGDPIREMFLYPDQLQEHVTLHKSGHLFIAGENIDQTMFVTVITSRGEIQDLKVVSAAKPSGPLILKSKPQSKEVNRKTVEAWLEDFGRGFAPQEFHRILATEPDRHTDQYIAQAKDSFVNDTHQVTLFEVINQLPETLTLEADQFSRPGEGIYVLRNTLEPNEKTQIVTIKKKGN